VLIQRVKSVAIAGLIALRNMEVLSRPPLKDIGYDPDIGNKYREHNPSRTFDAENWTRTWRQGAGFSIVLQLLDYDL
jgi:hypothetical protein